MIDITATWHNAGPHTIYAKLKERLGREPTHEEQKAEVSRILTEARWDRENPPQLAKDRG